MKLIHEMKTYFSLVKYLYTANCDIKDENSLEILKISIAFETNRLTNSICEHFIKKLPKFSIHMLINIFELSTVYKNQELKDKCSELINKYAMIAVNTAEWKKLAEKKPELILYLFYKY